MPIGWTDCTAHVADITENTHLSTEVNPWEWIAIALVIVIIAVKLILGLLVLSYSEPAPCLWSRFPKGTILARPFVLVLFRCALSVGHVVFNPLSSLRAIRVHGGFDWLAILAKFLAFSGLLYQELA